MKSFVRLSVLCCFAFAFTMAAVYYKGNAKHQDYPNQCYYEELKQPILFYESFVPQNQEGYCERIVCRPDYVIELHTCDKNNLYLNKTCNLESDYSLPYPSCCPKLVC